MDRFILPLLPLYIWAATTYPTRSPSFLNKTSPILAYMRRLCGGLSWQQASLLPAYLGLALCLLWLVLSSPRGCTAALKWQFDGVLLPILPTINRSCSHLYFDLCIPWSIYACERWERRRGGRRGGGRKRKAVTATMLATIPLGTPAVHLPFEGFSNRQAQHSNRVLQSLVCAPPHPESISAVCMLCTLRQKGVFFQLCPGSLKRVKWCCSPLWELQKTKARKQKSLFQNPPQTTAIRPKRVFCTQFARLSSVLACLWNRQRQASGRL